MPGKVNPSVPECVEMIAYQIVGNDAAVSRAAAAGELELNVMTPLVAFNLAWSHDLLTAGLRLLRVKCVAGLRVNRERCRALVERSLLLATALSPYLGYEVVAEVVKEAIRSGRSLREVVLAHRLLPPRALDRLLDPLAVTRPRVTEARLARAVRASPAYRAYRARLGGSA